MGELPLPIKPGVFYIKPIDAPDSEFKEIKVVSSKDIHFDVGEGEDISCLSMPKKMTFTASLSLTPEGQKIWAYFMKMKGTWLFYAKRHPRKLKKQYKKIVEASYGGKVLFKYAFKHYYL